MFFILLAQAGDDAGMWPLALARCASIPLALLLMRPMGANLRMPAATTALTAVAGVLDIAANGFYLLASFGGQISVVAPVASLYPTSTVVLALLINKERLRPIQFVGLGTAAVALVLAAS